MSHKPQDHFPLNLKSHEVTFLFRFASARGPPREPHHPRPEKCSSTTSTTRWWRRGRIESSVLTRYLSPGSVEYLYTPGPIFADHPVLPKSGCRTSNVQCGLQKTAQSSPNYELVGPEQKFQNVSGQISFQLLLPSLTGQRRTFWPVSSHGEVHVAQRSSADGRLRRGPVLDE